MLKRKLSYLREVPARQSWAVEWVLYFGAHLSPVPILSSDVPISNTGLWLSEIFGQYLKRSWWSE